MGQGADDLDTAWARQCEPRTTMADVLAKQAAVPRLRPAARPTVAPQQSGDDRIDSAIRKLRILKRDFNMKGAYATTMERAIDLLRSFRGQH